MTCVCGSNKDYLECCRQYIEGKIAAPTPEALMRSRYTAFTLSNTDYIGKTQCKAAGENFDEAGTQAWAQDCTWQKLVVHTASPISNTDTEGTVSFTVHYQEHQLNKQLAEVSTFEKINDQWFYTKGHHTVKHQQLPGRNEPCLCGSGKKYKKCCG